MIQNLGYVLPGLLAGCAHPGRFGDLREALAELAQVHGFTAIVTLTERPLPAGAPEEFGLASLHVPITDFEAPSIDAAEQVVDFVQRHLASGGRVVVHCAAGVGRTGTMLACVLVSRGLSAAAAIQMVRRQRPGSIETLDQERFVQAWEEHADGGAGV